MPTGPKNVHHAMKRGLRARFPEPGTSGRRALRRLSPISSAFTSGRLAGCALTLLEVFEKRSAGLLEVLPHHLQDACSAPLQLRGRLTGDPDAGPAELVGAERDGRTFHGVHE